MTKKKKIKKQVIFKNGVLVPEKFVTKEILKDFEHRIINYYGGGEKNIDWDYYDPDESDLVIKGYKYMPAKKAYLFYSGRRDLLNKNFGDFDVIDKRVKVPWSKWSTEHIKLRKHFRLKESQVEMVDQWMHKKHGIIRAAARSGKTVIMSYIVQKMKQKTLILANQRELLVQWQKEFSTVVTNCEDVRTEKHPVIGIMRKWSDIDKYDIVLTTWQIWNTNKAKLRKYRNAFGLIFVDEIHRCNADCPKNVISQFNARYKGGVTATVERKDGRHYYMDFIVGPVTAEVETEQMKCKICRVKTNLPIKICQWTYYINRLCNSPERNKMIIKLCYRLAKQGRYVVVGSDRTNHIKKLVKRLKKLGVKAAGFYSNVKDRATLLEKAKAKKIQVFVANRSMLTGINVPCWDVYMNILPLNNPPTYYQQFSRIRTPMKGKPTPIIYDFVEDDGPSMGLFNKRAEQYKQEGFKFIPTINGDLKIDEEKIEEQANLSHWKRRMSIRKKAKPFFNAPTAHKDGVSIAALFK